MDFNFEKENILEGLTLIFDKPYRWTSFDLVNKIRHSLCKFYGLKKLKVGHAGTLDPLATGLLIICTGKATKKIVDIQDLPKEYIAEITLGATTPSFDLETKIDNLYHINHINQSLIEELIKKFIGKIDQVPPMFSAKYIDGVRAYELARSGVEMELKPSKVEIYNLEILNFISPVLKLKINCSKGTYIRSLARDIGVELNSGGYLTALKRTTIGNYNISEAINIEEFLQNFSTM